MNSSMKSFLGFALFAVLFAFVVADSPISSDEKEDKAIRECNITNPVHRNPSEIIAQSIAAGDIIVLSQEEKFDEKGDIRGSGLVNHTLREAPSLAKYADVIITQVFQIIRTTKGVQDKCKKAVIAFHQYIQNIFTLALAEGLQNFIDVKGKIVKAVVNNEPYSAEDEKNVKQFLILVNGVLKAFANGIPHEVAITSSPAPAQLETKPVV